MVEVYVAQRSGCGVEYGGQVRLGNAEHHECMMLQHRWEERRGELIIGGQKITSVGGTFQWPICLCERRNNDARAFVSREIEKHRSAYTAAGGLEV